MNLSVWIAATLRRTRFTYRDERQLHQAIEQALTDEGLHPKPEVRLGYGRIDFLVNRVGVEVKTKGSLEAVTRQLSRYATSDNLDALVLATTTRRHLAVPRELAGKPVTVVILGGGW